MASISLARRVLKDSGYSRNGGQTTTGMLEHPDINSSIAALPMIWRDIPGFSKYEASDEGAIRFKNWQTNPHAKPIRTATKYRKWLYVCLYDDNGRKQTIGVHRLVALAFLGLPPEGHEVAHGDGDGANNRIGNLRYATYEENQLDVIRHKRRPTKLHVDDVARIRACLSGNHP